MTVFDDIKVGQQVVIYNPHTELYEIHKTERETKTQLTINSMRFLKSSGYEFGSVLFGYFIVRNWPSGQLMTVEEANSKNESWQLEQKRLRLANKIRGVTFREKSYEVLVKVAELLGVTEDE